MINPAVYVNSGEAQLRPPPGTAAIRALERWPDPGVPPDGLIRLNRNERVDPLPESFVSRIREAISSDLLASYPPTDELYAELCSSLGVERDRVLLTNGSDGAIRATYQAFLEPGNGVVALDPSYAMYEVYAQMFEGRFHGVSVGHGLQVDLPRLLAAIEPGVRLVMIANPNQPTGVLAAESVMLELLERAAEVGALLAVDEAHFPFSKLTMLPRVEEFPNLVVIRTFSKAAGLAGLRIGFLVGHPEVVSTIAKVRTISDVNSVAVVSAREILRTPELVTDYVSEVAAGGRILAERVSQLGLEPISTAAGFMLIRVAPRCDPQRLVESLVQLGYLVKGPFSPACIADCIRVTCGSPALMSAFATALEQAVEQLAGADDP